MKTFEEIKKDLKEIKEWCGSWDELREVIDQIEDNENKTIDRWSENMTNNPVKTANILISNGFTIEQYEEVQNQRKERMRLWKERDIKILSDNEQELIDFGEEVLKIMKANKL